MKNLQGSSQPFYFQLLLTVQRLAYKITEKSSHLQRESDIFLCKTIKSAIYCRSVYVKHAFLKARILRMR